MSFERILAYLLVVIDTTLTCSKVVEVLVQPYNASFAHEHIISFLGLRDAPGCTYSARNFFEHISNRSKND